MPAKQATIDLFMPHILVGTAGHIDHGKTALVKALTGIDADRLKEEKARGITIDIGFANLQLDGGTTIGFVDVPGHERFIKNMLAGVGGIDAVMLVVAADESIMPQTREHLDICSLLRIERGLTVLTKVDATDGDIVDLAEIEVREFLRGSFLESAPVLRVSSHTAEGIPLLIDTLRGLAAASSARDASRVFRLPIDRAFTMKGFGTVISGTLISGRIQKEEDLEVLPHGRSGRVRGIQVHGTAVEAAIAGQRTALNLQRIDLADVERGMVAVPPGVFTPTTLFDVLLELLPSAGAPILRRKRVRFHVGTTELMGYAVLLGQDTLEPGANGIAQIRLEAPTLALPGDRFIVRQYSPMKTIGGGEILDSRPRRHRRSDAAVRDRLLRLPGAETAARLLAIVEAAGAETVSVPDIVARLGIAPAEASARAHALVAEGRTHVVGDSPLTIVEGGVFERLTRQIENEVARFHEREPLVKGISREALKGCLSGKEPVVLFRAALDHLVASRRIALDQEVVHAFNRGVTLNDEDARIRTLLSDRYRELRLQAPSPDEVIAGLGVERQRARKIVQLLLKEGTLVRIAADMMVDREALAGLIAAVRALKARSTSFGVGEFKELTGLSRKYAVPLLEYLDSQRVTRRTGEGREIL
ncbi:selenocysteine-specific translation elongation factor [soil metagenome]